jgi:hypothetical protein
MAHWPADTLAQVRPDLLMLLILIMEQQLETDGQTAPP